MALFQYQGFDRGAKTQKGVVEAATLKEAKDKLRVQGVLVSSIQEKSASSTKAALKKQALVTFTLQLAQLINAGLPLYESLVTLEEQYRTERFHGTLLSITELVRGGSSLSDAMQKHPESFDKLYCSMVAAGEAAGALGPILNRLSHYLTRQQKLEDQIRTALIYPSVLATFAILLVIGMLTFVVPMVEQLFEGRELNAITSFVLGTSAFFRSYWYLIILVLGGTLGGLVYWLRTPQGQAQIQSLFLRTPVLRTLMIHSSVSRFSETMGTLLEGGLPLVEALTLGREVIGLRRLEDGVDMAKQRVIDGSSLSVELAKLPLLPPLVHRLVAVGEDTGQMAEMWEHLAEMYEGELEKSLDRILALAQPLIIVFMGLVVGLIMLGIVLPLTELGNIVQ